MRRFRIKADLRVKAVLEKTIVADSKEEALEKFDEFADNADDGDFNVLWETTYWIGEPFIQDLGEHVDQHPNQGRLKF